MRVFCVHFVYALNGKVVEMPPRTVKHLNEAGSLFTRNGKPEGDMIKMNWEPFDNKGTWNGESEIAWNIKAMAHEIEGVPGVERVDCEYYSREAKSSKCQQ